MVPRLREGETGNAEVLILNAIEKKRLKGGAAYARGKTLIVFLEAGTAAGQWFPNRVAGRLPQPLEFATVWVVALKVVKEGEYVYNVTHLDVSEGDAPGCLCASAENSMRGT